MESPVTKDVSGRKKAMSCKTIQCVTDNHALLERPVLRIFMILCNRSKHISKSFPTHPIATSGFQVSCFHSLHSVYLELQVTEA